jgi:hypothetical protein
VRMFEASADLERKIDDLRGLELSALFHLVRKRGSLDTLHDDERPAVVLADVKDLDDVGMGELGGETRLPEEAVVKAGRVSEVLGENLDRDAPLELSIACEVDGGHAAAPKDTLDPVPPVGEGLGAQLLSSVVVDRVVPSVVASSSSWPFLPLPLPLSSCFCSSQLTSFWRSVAVCSSSS